MRRFFFAILVLIPLAAALAAGNVPPALFFVANEGQWEEPFAFKAAVGNAIYYVTPTGMTMDIREYDRPQRARDPMDRFDPRHEQEPTTVRGHVLRFNFLNANPSPEIIGEDKLSSYSNYFLGRDSCKWRSFVGHYQTVRMKNVWPGIDVVQKVQPEGVETVYRVQAGANAQQINVQVEGLTAPLRVDGAGNLILSTSLGEVKEKAPFAYQIMDRRQVEVLVQYQVLANDKYNLAFSTFDVGHELVIDPLVYSSFFGGNGYNNTFGITTDGNDNIIVCGFTDTGSFPTTPGAYQTQYYGFFFHGTVSKLTPDGHSLLFSTYLSGTSGTPNDYVYPSQVLADRHNSIYVVGYFTSGIRSFPLTTDAFDTVMGSGEGFISRLSESGAILEFSTYLGGSQEDGVWNVQIDSAGLVYVAGRTSSTDFPTTPNAMYGELLNNGCPFVSVIDPASSALVYSTFFPGATTEEHMCLQSPMRVWLYGTTYDYTPTTPDALQPTPQTRFNGYLSLLDLAAGELVYSTYFGGHGQTEVHTLLPDGANGIVLAGRTNAPDFPVTTGAFDTVRPSVDGYPKGFFTHLIWPQTIVSSTLYGEGISEHILRDGHGSIVGCGMVGGALPTTPDGYDTTYNGMNDVFLCRLSPDLSQLEYGTYLGGTQRDRHPDVVCTGANSYWIAGSTYSLDFPTTPDAYQRFSPSGGYYDGFISHFILPPDDVDDHPHVSLPTSYRLNVFPNPFNPSTTISFSLPKSSPVRFDVFDMLGRTVYRADLGRMNAGTHQQPFNLPGLASGTYVVRLEAGTTAISRKMAIIR
jgi:hypothetical protein